MPVITPGVAHASVSVVEDDTARVNGKVFAIAQVGDRTILGGEFTRVGGHVRNHVAAIKADGTLDRTWNPNVDGTVYAVAGSDDGSQIYLGGLFTSVAIERIAWSFQSDEDEERTSASASS